MPTGAVEFRYRPGDEWELAHHRVGTRAEVLESGLGILREMVDMGSRRAQVRVVWESGRIQKVRLQKCSPTNDSSPV